MPETVTSADGVARVAGVDLAAEAAGTALAVLRVEPGCVALEHLRLGVDDDTLLAETRAAELIGIDCAFGWPVDFVDFVARQASGARLTSDDTGDLAWRRRLAHRETDRVVTERTGARPLSVATDRLGMTALRCAVLLDRLAGDGRVVDRAGEHPSAVVEVYPAMALRVWGLARPGYKLTTDARTVLIADLRRAAGFGLRRAGGGAAGAGGGKQLAHIPGSNPWMHSSSAAVTPPGYSPPLGAPTSSRARSTSSASPTVGIATHPSTRARSRCSGAGGTECPARCASATSAASTASSASAEARMRGSCSPSCSQGAARRRSAIRAVRASVVSL